MFSRIYLHDAFAHQKIIYALCLQPFLQNIFMQDNCLFVSKRYLCNLFDSFLIDVYETHLLIILKSSDANTFAAFIRKIFT